MTVLFMLLGLPYIASIGYFVVEVGRSYWQLNPAKLLDGMTDATLLAHMAAYGCFTVLAGYACIVKFSSFIPSPLRPFYVLAGFVPGYLIITALNRLVTAILPNIAAVWCLLGIYGAICLYAVFVIRKSHGSWAKHALQVSASQKVKYRTLPILSCIGILTLFFVNEVQVSNTHDGGYHVMGDGAQFFLELIQTQNGFEPDQHFPVITQHYDEIMFLYPLLQPNIHDISKAMENAVNCYWVLYSLGKTSCFIIVLLSLNAWARSWTLAALTALLLFFGSIHPLPVQSFLLFDASNPLSITMHTGRIIIAVMPLAVITLCLHKKSLVKPSGLARKSILLFLGIGCSSLSLHFLVVIALTFLVASSIKWKASLLHTCLTIGLSMLSILLIYSSSVTMGVGAFLLIVNSLVVIYPFLKGLTHSFTGKKDLLVKSRKWLLNNFAPFSTYLIGVMLGLCFLGNGLTAKFYELTGLQAPVFLTRIVPTVSWEFGKNPYCGLFPMIYCANILAFTSLYGLPFIFTGLAATINLNRYKSRTDYVCDTKTMTIMHLLSVILLILSICFFILDFTDGAATKFEYLPWLAVWVKSRLAEPWFYALISLGIIVLYHQGDIRTKNLIILALAVHILLRHLLSDDGGIFGQLAVNTAYLYQRTLELW